MSDAAQPTARNPYVGPRPFSREDRFFYGREREVRELRDLLIAERIVILYSPSGAGKTSLIQAGLLPALEEEDFRILPIVRVNQPFGEDRNNGANRYVTSALFSLESARPLAEQRDPDALARMTIAEYLAALPRPEGSPTSDVLIFDQFEEILTLDPTDEAAKRDFFDQVGKALRHRDRWALFSLREDHLAALDPFLPAIPTRLETSFRIELLGPEAALQAIQRPSAEVGVTFADEAARRLVADLRQVRVQRLDGTIEEVPGPHVEPVQLQVVCQRLWDHLGADTERIDLELVESYGDVDGALQEFYRESVRAVTRQTGVPERDLRDWFDEQLITEHGVRGQVLQEPGEGAGLPDQAVRALIDTHLVRADARRGATWYELAHDRLIDPVRADNDAWYQANLSPLQKQAELWDSQGRLPGYLLTGEVLTKSAAWATSHADSLTDVDRAFLVESEKQRDLQEAEQNERRLLEEQRLNEQTQARLQAEEAARHEAEQRAAEQKKATRRAVLLFGTAAVAAAIALVAAIWGFNEQGEAKRQRATAQAQATVVDLERLQSESRLLAEQAQRAGPGTPNGLLLAAEAVSTDDTAEARRALLKQLWSVPVATLQGSGEVRGLAFSPEGNALVTAGSDGVLRRWSTSTWEPLGELVTNAGAIIGVSFVPDGGPLVTGGADGVSLREPETLTVRAQLTTDPVTSVVVSGKEIVAGDANGQVLLFDTDTQQGMPLPLSDALTRSPVNALAISDGWIAAGREDGTITLWDQREDGVHPPVATLPPLGPRDPATPSQSAIAIASLAFDRNGTTLAAGTSDGMIWLWDVAAQQVRGSLKLSQAPPKSLAFSLPDNFVIAAAYGLPSPDSFGTVVLWDVNAQSRSAILPINFADGAWSVAYSPDGEFLATGGGGGVTYLWRRAERPLFAPRSADFGVRPATPTAAFAATGTRLALAGEDDTVGVCTKTADAYACEPLVLDIGSVRSLALSMNGDLLAAGGERGAITVRALDGSRDAESFRTGSSDETVGALVFASDSQTLFAGTAGPAAEQNNLETQTGAIVILDVETGSAQRVDRPAPVTALAANASSPNLASSDSEFLVWTDSGGDLGDPQPLPTPTPTPGQGAAVIATPTPAPHILSFDRIGTRVGAAGLGGVTVWDAGSHELRLSNGIQMRGTQSLVFSPDNSRFATGTSFGSVFLWDLEQWGPTPVFLGTLPTGVVGLSWEDSGVLVVVDAEGRIVELDLDRERWIDRACRAVQDFASEELRQVAGDASAQVCAENNGGNAGTPIPGA